MNSDAKEPYYGGLNELLAIEQCMPNYNAFIVDKFLDYLEKKESYNVVDFGAGIGTLSLVIEEKTGIKPLCLEIDLENQSFLNKRGFPVIDGLDHMKQPADAVFSSNVLEHIEDDVKILRSIHEHLAEQGLLFLYLPAFQLLFSDLDIKVGHYRRYSKRSLVEKVRSCGFDVVACEYADSIGFFASLAMKVLGYNNESGLGSAKSLKFYDRFLLPVSSVVDMALFRHLFGKNIILAAKKR